MFYYPDRSFERTQIGLTANNTAGFTLWPSIQLSQKDVAEYFEKAVQ